MMSAADRNLILAAGMHWMSVVGRLTILRQRQRPCAWRLWFRVILSAALNFMAVGAAVAAPWVTNGPLVAACQSHTATLLPDGTVLVTGGWDGINALAGAQRFDPATGKWTATSAPCTNRSSHTATLLPNGRVLAAGGKANDTSLCSAELFDPVAGVWTATGNLNVARNSHTATLLSNGQVLVVGGYNGNVLSSVEIYSPETGLWTAANGLNVPRGNHTATLLPNGQVLVAGGWSGDPNSLGIATVEVFDPNTGAWTSTNQMSVARQNHTATLLLNGRVLIAGGACNAGSTNSAELFDPSSGKWTATGSLTNARIDHAASLLPNGKVLITGGYHTNSLAASELYDPAAGAWTTNRSLNFARHAHTATVLANGRVLVAGGSGVAGVTAITESWEPATGTWLDTGSLSNARTYHTVTLLADGRVLAAGGFSPGGHPEIAEVYDPTTGTWSLTGTLNVKRSDSTATLLPSGKVLLAGGVGASSLASTELYDPATGGWTLAADMTSSRASHTATLLGNGKVLVAAGRALIGGTVYLNTAEIYDPASGTWRPTAPLAEPRFDHTATLLPNGMVLVAGGLGTNGPLATAELYDAASETWWPTGPMIAARRGHTATLLPNGKVLIAGGGPNVASPPTVLYTATELYDPAIGTWTETGPLTAARSSHTATLLPDGKVLAVSGIKVGNTTLPSVELYDPATGNWTLTGSLATSRQSHAASLLPDGKVLVVGGVNQPNSFTATYLTSAQVYDAGRGFSPSSQPQIIATSSPIGLGSSLLVAGSLFRGTSEGSSGNSQNSAANYPLVQLRNLESSQMTFLPLTNWSGDSLATLPLIGFPPGYALATVFVNGIQSTGHVVQVSVPSPTTDGPIRSQLLVDGSFRLSFTNAIGAALGILGTTNLALSPTNWASLGQATEVAPGSFEFTDLDATNHPQRFYRVRAP